MTVRGKAHNKILGDQGERAAAESLRRAGYEIIGRNLRTPYGEVDLVARHMGFTVFVEVKTRRSRAHGLPEEAVTARKRTRLIRSAQHYLQERGLLDTPWRIDVVAVEFGRAGDSQRIEVFENAVRG
ncbi:MAG: YraN family protein [Anaerolineales bacterium]|nr:YraN family protein [Anaerolineales bacterium]